jgi:hypothetical protein
MTNEFKDQALAKAQEIMKELSQELNYDNYGYIRTELDKVFKMIEATKNLGMRVGIHPVEEGKGSVIMIEEPTEEEVKATIEENVEQVEDIVESFESVLPVYTFVRKLKGGVLPKENGEEIYMPETFVRDLGVTHGSKVSARFVDVGKDGQPDQYEFFFVGDPDGTEPPLEISEIKFGIATYVPKYGSYAVEKDMYGERIMDEYGDPATIRIDDVDSNKLHIREGDIVDLAFYDNAPKKIARVRWLHKIDASKEESKSSSYYKKKDTEKKDVEKIFEGKVICVLGNEPSWGKLREEVEIRGGKLETLNNKESNISMVTGALDRSDCLVIFKSHTGHSGRAGSPKAVAYCKEINIPYDSLDGYGRTSFIRMVGELLGVNAETSVEV